MAEEVKSVQAVSGSEAKSVEQPKVETPKVVNVEEYEALKRELDAIKGSIDERVNKASKAEREKFEKQLAKAKMTAEEALKAEQEEKWNAINSELNTLKTEKKQFLIKDHLQKSELPSFFQNDSRLVNAEPDQIESVVKSLKKEYQEYLKETSKTAVVGTAPKSPTTTSPNAEVYAKLVAKYPHLRNVLKK
jgi:arsenate reductase-like glutaredoxin family protein